jgi:hypothetical protein
METKTCTGCEEPKPLTEFHKDKALAEGRKARCKVCMNKRKEESKLIPRVTVYCLRKKQKMSNALCVLDSGVECKECKYRDKAPVKVSSSTLTPEEEARNRKEFTDGMSQFGELCESEGSYIDSP